MSTMCRALVALLVFSSPSLVAAAPFDESAVRGATSGSVFGALAPGQSAAARAAGAAAGTAITETARALAARVAAMPPPEPPDPRDALEDEMFGGDDARDTLEDEMFGGGDDARDALEDDLFGGGGGGAPGDRDEDILGEQARGGGLLGRLAQLEDDPLAIGGQLYTRLQVDYSEGDDEETTRLSSPNLLDLYLDARPTDRLRAFVRGRIRHDFTLSEPPAGGLPDDGDGDGDGDEDPLAEVPGQLPGGAGRPADETTVDLDQLWLKFDIERVVYVTFGRQAVRWGTGRFWNPTDFLNQQTRDPLAVFDDRLGVSLLRLHFPIEPANMNIFAVAVLEDADSPARVGGALRWEWLIELTEVALSAAVRKDEPLKLGVDLSSGLWLFDVRVEAAATYDDENTRYWEGDFALTPRLVLPTPFVRDDEWTFQVVAGTDLTIDYGDEDSLVIGAEYFYNQVGYDTPDINPWLLLNGDFRPLYNGQHYGALYTLLAAPGTWNDTTFILSTLGNLTDPSFVTRLDYRVTVLTYLQLVAWGTLFLGEEGGEFKPALEVPPLPFEGLEQGLDIAPPLFQLGIGALLAI